MRSYNCGGATGQACPLRLHAPPLRVTRKAKRRRSGRRGWSRGEMRTYDCGDLATEQRLHVCRQVLKRPLSQAEVRCHGLAKLLLRHGMHIYASAGS